MYTCSLGSGTDFRGILNLESLLYLTLSTVSRMAEYEDVGTEKISVLVSTSWAMKSAETNIQNSYFWMPLFTFKFKYLVDK